MTMDRDYDQSVLATIKFLFPIVITDEDGRTSDFPELTDAAMCHPISAG